MQRYTLGSKPVNPGPLHWQSGILEADGSHVLPTISAVLRRSKRRRDKNSPLRKAVENALSEARGLLHPSAVWARLEYENLASDLIAHLPEDFLSRTGSVTGVICTIGSQLEQQVGRLFSAEHFSEGYLLDHVGTLAVANWAQQAARTLSAEQQATRWAPGDDAQDWSLSGQRMLFECIPSEKIGVQLSSSNVMTPAKSLSYLLMIGKTLDHHGCRLQCRCCVWNGICELQEARQADEAW